MVARRFDVHLVSLDPTLGSEIQKTRPCLITNRPRTHAPPSCRSITRMVA